MTTPNQAPTMVYTEPDLHRPLSAAVAANAVPTPPVDTKVDVLYRLASPDTVQQLGQKVMQTVFNG